MAIEVIEKREELLSRARAESGAPRAGGDAGSALSRYRVIRPLSQGGMAEILLAVHEGIGGFEKLIALKKIRRKLLEKKHIAVELFLNEAKIAANLNHPNIVQIFEVGEHGGDLFIAMEYVHGVDARDVLRRGPANGQKLSLDQILYIGTQVAAALNHAHNARDLNGRKLNIVHRDVSLSNIVIGFDGHVKLVDFGIAVASVVNAKEGLIGKFSYMSPEQIAKQPLDGRSDVFSLGIVLYELISGRPLFRRETDDLTTRAVQQDPIPSLASHGVPGFVEEVMLRALERDRTKRFADAREFELALSTCLQRMGSQINAHQLSLFMKQLFGDESATLPTVSGVNVSGEAERGATPSENSGPSHSYRVSTPPWEKGGIEGEEDTAVHGKVTDTPTPVTAPIAPAQAASGASSARLAVPQPGTVRSSFLWPVVIATITAAAFTIWLFTHHS
jgi:serine/threonine-protein kinase